MTVLKSILVLIISTSPTALYGAATDENINYEYDFYLLQQYKLKYTNEIFDFCVGKYGTTGSAPGGCMIGQNKIKNRILDLAHDQLGRRSLAQDIYDDCLDYHPINGVARISECVRTRLVLNGKLGNDLVENEIYRKCDFKWRKHSFRAIDNCARTQANYFRDKGQLPD